MNDSHVKNPSWKWEEVDVSRTNLSGDFAKLFKNEWQHEYGAFTKDSPPSPTTVLAREVIQNSWDSALELRSQMSDKDSEYPTFELTFNFKELTGDEKLKLIDSLDLRELGDQFELADSVSDDSQEKLLELGLASDCCLDSLDDESIPLKVLYIEETGTTGMYGKWGRKSRMYQALAALGTTLKSEGGGSFGYGKAGLIGGSKLRTVLAYSAFEERPEEKGVTRRLLGMTYWKDHEISDYEYTGISRFADNNNNISREGGGG